LHLMQYLRVKALCGFLGRSVIYFIIVYCLGVLATFGMDIAPVFVELNLRQE